MSTTTLQNISECIEVCLNLSKGKVSLNDDGDIVRRMLISPEYLLEYISAYCLDTVESIKKVYNENDRLYADANDFISTFILNINDDRERHMFYDFMWNTETFRERIMSLKSGDAVPYPNNINGFILEVMEYGLRDSWQCILSINDIRQGSGIDIHNNIYKINLDDYTPFE